MATDAENWSFEGEQALIKLMVRFEKRSRSICHPDFTVMQVKIYPGIAKNKV